MMQQNVRKFADALQQSYLNYFGMLPNLAWIRGHQNFYVVRVKTVFSKWAFRIFM